MRTTDERVAAVHRRSGRLRRRRADAALAALAILLVLPLAGLAGRYAMSDLAPAPGAGAGLFGASSLFGPSAGGYVLVAVVSFAVAVTATALAMLRRRGADNEEQQREGGEGHHGKAT